MTGVELSVNDIMHRPASKQDFIAQQVRALCKKFGPFHGNRIAHSVMKLVVAEITFCNRITHPATESLRQTLRSMKLEKETTEGGKIVATARNVII